RRQRPLRRVQAHRRRLVRRRCARAARAGWVAFRRRRADRADGLAGQPAAAGAASGQCAELRRAGQGRAPVAIARADVPPGIAPCAARTLAAMPGAGREQGDAWLEAERLIAAIAEPRAAKALA